MIIAGAGGHAREIMDLLDMEGLKDVFFFDNVSVPLPSKVDHEKVIRDEDSLARLLVKSPGFILGTGVPAVRSKLYSLFVRLGGRAHTCIATTAIKSERAVEIGEGCNIMHNVFLSNHVRIGKGSLVNAGVHLHHDVNVGEFCELGPACILLGNVLLGNRVFVGAGAVLLPGVIIGDEAIIGAGSVVIKNVAGGITVKGNPAM